MWPELRNGQRREHRRQPGHAADREVDLARRDHEGHGDGHHRDGRGLPDDVQQVVAGQEPGVVQEDREEEKHQREAALRRALSSLPSELRDVFLVDETKETQREAAKRLEISLATYKRRRSLGLARLKEALE